MTVREVIRDLETDTRLLTSRFYALIEHCDRAGRPLQGQYGRHGAEKALEASEKERTLEAFEWLDKLFSGVPSYQ